MAHIKILIDQKGQWFRYWSGVRPALFAPIYGENPLDDLKALADLVPLIGCAEPEGETFQVVDAILCSVCEGTGKVEEIDPDPDWNVDERGEAFREPPGTVQFRCSNCLGDGGWINWYSNPMNREVLLPTKGKE